MVVLSETSPLPSKTAHRARGATLSCASRLPAALKSSNRIELGRFTYDACRRLGLCSKEGIRSNDPDGYSDETNLFLYVASAPTRYIDPSGLTLQSKCEDVCAKQYPHWYQYLLFAGCISGCHDNAEVKQFWNCYSSCVVDIHTCPTCLIGGAAAGQIEIVRSHLPVLKPGDLRFPPTNPPWTTMNRIIAARLRGLGCERIADAMMKAATRVSKTPLPTAPGRIVGGIVITEAAFSLICSTTCTVKQFNSP
jgi:hypothetical protein